LFCKLDAVTAIVLDSSLQINTNQFFTTAQCKHVKSALLMLARASIHTPYDTEKVLLPFSQQKKKEEERKGPVSPAYKIN